MLSLSQVYSNGEIALNFRLFLVFLVDIKLREVKETVSVERTDANSQHPLM